MLRGIYRMPLMLHHRPIGSTRRLLLQRQGQKEA